VGLSGVWSSSEARFIVLFRKNPSQQRNPESLYLPLSITLSLSYCSDPSFTQDCVVPPKRGVLRDVVIWTKAHEKGSFILKTHFHLPISLLVVGLRARRDETTPVIPLCKSHRAPEEDTVSIQLNVSPAVFAGETVGALHILSTITISFKEIPLPQKLNDSGTDIELLSSSREIGDCRSLLWRQDKSGRVEKCVTDSCFSAKRAAEPNQPLCKRCRRHGTH